jgi:hypothetical protein
MPLQTAPLKDCKKNYLLVLAFFLALYWLTCAPGSLWQDSGEFHYRTWNNQIETEGTLVRAHPLYIASCIVTKFIPGGNFAGKVNLVSAFFGAITVANIFLLVLHLTNNKTSAWVSALALGLSWTFWQHAAIAEVYTLYTAILSTELLVLFLYLKTSRIGYLYALFFLNGLSIANHLFGILPLFVYCSLLAYQYIVEKKFKANILVFLPFFWAIGSSPYLILIVRRIFQTGEITSTIKSAIFGNWQNQVTNFSVSFSQAFENIGYILYTFCSPAIFLLIIGLFFWRKNIRPKSLNLSLFSLLILFLVFAFRYKVPDRYAFFIPFYLVSAIYIGIGCNELLKTQFFTLRWPRLFLVILVIACPLFFYWQTPIVLEQLKYPIGTRRTIPYRNDYTYFLRPWQHTNTGPSKFAEESFNLVPPHSAIYADGTVMIPLWIHQTVNQKRPDIRLLSEADSLKVLEQFADQGLLYVVSPVKDYCPQTLLDHYNFEKFGPLYRVKPKTNSEIN